MIKLLLILLLSLPASAQRIKENSKLGKLTARILDEPEAAIVIGKTIYLSCDLETFVKDSTWVNHELKHLKQYEKYGKYQFFIRYGFYWLIYGYKKHPFERDKIKP